VRIFWVFVSGKRNHTRLTIGFGVGGAGGAMGAPPLGRGVMAWLVNVVANIANSRHTKILVFITRLILAAGPGLSIGFAEK
jgi:hypothetical protein